MIHFLITWSHTIFSADVSLPLCTGCSELLLMSSYSAVCFIFIVPCVAQGLIYCVLLNPVLRAKSIKRLWPGDLVCWRLCLLSPLLPGVERQSLWPRCAVAAVAEQGQLSSLDPQCHSQPPLPQVTPGNTSSPVAATCCHPKSKQSSPFLAELN